MNIKEKIKTIVIDKPLKLDCGQTINKFPLAYETYGSLNENKDNAILVCHALTGDQFVTGLNPITKKDGWWSFAVGPNDPMHPPITFAQIIKYLFVSIDLFGPTA